MDFSSITGSTSFLLQGAAYTFELTATSAIGAITHVFVNHPEKGYGVFAENMLARN